MSSDGTRIGSLKQVVELRARIAELEAAVQAGRDLMAIVHGDGGHYREAHGDRKAADDAIAIVIDLRVELAAERERREAAEALLLELVAVVRGECPSLLDEDSGGDARTSLDIDAHFARYKKEPT